MTPHWGQPQLLAPVQLRRRTRTWSDICYNVYWLELKPFLSKLLIQTFFLLLLAYRHSRGNFSSRVFVWLGIGKLSSCFYSINDSALDLAEELWKTLSFFQAYTRCDMVLSFFNHGKCMFWDRWFDFENKSLLIKVFSELSQRPTNIPVAQTTHLEKYLLNIYYPHMTGISDLNFQGMQDFEFSVDSNLHLLPPSKAGYWIY